jgi:hypothetical protein
MFGLPQKSRKSFRDCVKTPQAVGKSEHDRRIEFYLKGPVVITCGEVLRALALAAAKLVQKITSNNALMVIPTMAGKRMPWAPCLRIPKRESIPNKSPPMISNKPMESTITLAPSPAPRAPKNHTRIGASQLALAACFASILLSGAEEALDEPFIADVLSILHASSWCCFLWIISVGRVGLFFRESFPGGFQDPEQ